MPAILSFPTRDETRKRTINLSIANGHEKIRAGVMVPFDDGVYLSRSKTCLILKHGCEKIGKDFPGMNEVLKENRQFNGLSLSSIWNMNQLKAFLDLI